MLGGCMSSSSRRSGTPSGACCAGCSGPAQLDRARRSALGGYQSGRPRTRPRIEVETLVEVEAQLQPGLVDLEELAQPVEKNRIIRGSLFANLTSSRLAPLSWRTTRLRR